MKTLTTTQRPRSVTTTKQWFRLTDHTPDGLLCWQALGHKSIFAIRHWIRAGISEGWLRPGKHIKPLYPDRKKSPWLLHLENCQNLRFS